MKHLFIILFTISAFSTSCVENKEPKSSIPAIETNPLLEIPQTTVDISMLDYDNKASLWTLNDLNYSGYSVTYHQDSTLKKKVAILNGKKENQSTRWFPDGHLKQLAHYHKGKLHGEKKMWSSEADHILISHLNYYLGKAHGVQRKWYPSGELYKKLNLNMGREEGIQQAFRKNGDLYANYEAKNGRIFGLKKAALCFGLEDEQLKSSK